MSANSLIIPSVLDITRNERLDLFTKLFSERIIFIFNDITQQLANLVCAQLMYLDSVSRTQPIYLYINSNGGSVYDAIAILEVMDIIQAPVHTFVLGFAASAAALISIYGDVRKMSANSRMMIHQPMGGARGQATDIEIISQEINLLKTYINNIIVLKSNLSYSVVLDKTNRDCYLSADECKQCGFIDEITGKSIPIIPINRD